MMLCVFTGTWEADIDRVLVPGQQTEAGVFNLRPATTYHLRIVAENEIGISEPSDTVPIITAEEGKLHCVIEMPSVYLKYLWWKINVTKFRGQKTLILLLFFSIFLALNFHVLVVF